ncbi:hypothetical protein PHACT_14515 [Pseudohongiella acticola]|jgi:uncharacterized membrane protein|uniref:Signaling pathway modulator ZraP n=1 Tax=Pseudohongiella acticola TaxID=1524254 RepID=A0A1E8CFE5_9GAMM|nr:periplasmic heavy metal sensor [Pseudohongiella acticola]OFE11075.1 hypothetical protein PHACT_14515 [Pseudohongiella acticola]
MVMTRKRAMLWVLLVSIALNLFFIGTIGARLLDRSDRESTPPSLGWILRGLEPQMQDSLRPQLQRYGESIRPMRGQMFRAQREVNRLLAQDPLDDEAIQVAFEELRQINLRYQRVSHEQTLAVLRQLAPEQRSRVLRFLSGRRNPTEDGGGRRSGDDRRRDDDARNGEPN